MNVDNAANVQGAAHDLDCDCDGCTAHKFNLIAKDGIKASPEIKEVQTKMNGTIKFTKKSHEGKKFFLECQTLAEYEGMYDKSRLFFLYLLLFLIFSSKVFNVPLISESTQ